MINENTLVIELPHDMWRQFSTGKLLKTEMERIGAERAAAAGRKVANLVDVTTDLPRDVYVVTFALKPA